MMICLILLDTQNESYDISRRLSSLAKQFDPNKISENVGGILKQRYHILDKNAEEYETTGEVINIQKRNLYTDS